VLVACAGYSTSWPGAYVDLSLDYGLTWERLGLCPNAGIIGFAEAALPDVDDPNIWDEGSSVAVTVERSVDVPGSATEAEVLAGANMALLGDEIIQWRTAVVSGLSATLSGLRRGRFGTEWATGTHAMGDPFVGISAAALNFLQVPIEHQGKTVHFRAVTVGASDDTGIPRPCDLKHRNVMPLAVVRLAGARASDDALALSWVRRARFNGDLRDGGDVPLCETTEAYEVDVAQGATFLRTLKASSEAVVYSAAQQVEDGIAPGSVVSCTVYQVSSVAGRGFAASVTA
jgi:hypothetical protein